jgi:hypothetical protein
MCICEIAEHEGGEGEQMKTFEGGVEPFVMSGKAAEPRCPGEAAFDDPTAWQQHEASFCHGVLDHFKPQAMLFSGFGSVGAGGTLVYIGQFDRAAGHLLHLLGRRGDLFAIPLNGRRDGQRQQVPEGGDRDVDLSIPYAAWLRHSPPALSIPASIAVAAVDHHLGLNLSLLKLFQDYSRCFGVAKNSSALAVFEFRLATTSKGVGDGSTQRYGALVQQRQGLWLSKSRERPRHICTTALFRNMVISASGKGDEIELM